jgi:hypothetical protein
VSVVDTSGGVVVVAAIDVIDFVMAKWPEEDADVNLSVGESYQLLSSRGTQFSEHQLMNSSESKEESYQGEAKRKIHLQCISTVRTV